MSKFGSIFKKYQIKGYFDNIIGLDVTGWVFNKEKPDERIKISVIVDGKEVAEGIADEFRQDLLDEKIGDGRHAFTIRLPESIRDGKEHEIRVIAKDYNVELVNSPKRQSFDILSNIKKIQAIKEKVSSEIKDSVFLHSPKEIKEYFKGTIGESVVPQNPYDVKTIAFYLPQFHPILENSEWWSPGYTEWTKVVQAVPLFEGHYQPRIPQELGFYDLRSKEVIKEQVELAREYGIYGFCFHYYWFEGRRLLETPLNLFLEDKEIDMPFMICWANENWTRRWDGSEHEVLLQQVHNEETDIMFIEDVIPLFKDPRYIKINGAPVLIIYRVSLMPDPVKTFELWREIIKNAGFTDLYLIMAETFGLKDPYQYGFNASVDFPPHTTIAKEISRDMKGLDPEFTGNIFCYEDVVKHAIGKLIQYPPDYKWFPCVMLGWDNTPRRGRAGRVFHNFSPELFEVWLRACVDFAVINLKPEERLVFINAWNEWGEGTYLEPDAKYGRANLEAVKKVLTYQSNWKELLNYIEQLPEIKGDLKTTFSSNLRCIFNSFEKTNEYLMSIIGNSGLPKEFTLVKDYLPPSIIDRKRKDATIHYNIDQLNYHSCPKGGEITIDKQNKLHITGWAFIPNVILTEYTPGYFIFKEVTTGKEYFTFIYRRLQRDDVSLAYKNFDKEYTNFSGFRQIIDITNLPTGLYHLGIITLDKNGKVYEGFFDITLEVY